MVKQILTTFLAIASIFLMLGYFYLADWVIPRSQDRRRFWGWLTFPLSSLSILSLCLIWMLWEPLAQDFLPAFIVISLGIGFIFRESAVSPYSLADFWQKKAKRDTSSKQDR